MLEKLIGAQGGLSNTIEHDLSRRAFIKYLGAGIGATALDFVFPAKAFARKAQGLDSNASYSDIVDYVRNCRENIDYNSIWTNDIPVLFVGERHTSLSDKTEIATQIPEFKKRGMTHLAIEMIEEEYQPIIDGYFDGTVSREKVEELFKDGWDKGDGVVEKYMELVDAAKNNGIKILAIDLYTSTSAYGTGEFFGKRNSNWTRIIREALGNDPNARVLVYGGAGHSGYNAVDDTANEMLAQRGIKSKVIQFVGAEKPERTREETPELLIDLWDNIEYAAQRLGISDQKFVVPIGSKDPVYPADYMIHLPQVE